MVIFYYILWSLLPFDICCCGKRAAMYDGAIIFIFNICLVQLSVLPVLTTFRACVVKCKEIERSFGIRGRKEERRPLTTVATVLYIITIFLYKH